jgi:hypothetical protein
MRSYAENDSTTRTKRRPDDEIDEQRDVAESSNTARGSNPAVPDEQAEAPAFRPKSAAGSATPTNSPLLAVTAAAGVGVAAFLQGPNGVAAGGGDALAAILGSLAIRRAGIAAAVGVPRALIA